MSAATPAWEVATPAGWCKGGERISTAKRAYCARYTPLSWDEARAKCREEGGSLARLETAEEQDALRTKLATRNVVRGDFWIGLQRDEQDRWIWLDGTPLRAAFWSDGEPNNWGGGEPCAQVYAASGRWNDLSCDGRLPFLCSLPRKSEPASGGFQPFRCPGKLIQGRSGAYCYHDTPATWDEARQACGQAGGDLAMFPDERDYEALIGGESASLRVARFWIDLSDRAQEGAWVWGDGTPATSADWHPGEPNNAGNQEHCGELLLDHWNDMPCEAKQGWLCEAP